MQACAWVGFFIKQNVILPDVKPDRFTLHAVLEAYTHFSCDRNDNSKRMQKLYGVALQRRYELNVLTSMWMACGVLKGDVYQRRVGQVSYLQMRHQWEQAQADFAAGNLDTPCTSDFQVCIHSLFSCSLDRSPRSLSIRPS
jgi:hypothetical protein